MTRNVALVARAHKQRSLQRIEGARATEEGAPPAAAHRGGSPVLPDLLAHRHDRDASQRGPRAEVGPTSTSPSSGWHLNRGLVAVGYEVHRTRGKTKTARPPSSSTTRPSAVLEGWRAYQAAELVAVGIEQRRASGCSPTATGNRSTPTPSTRRSGESCTTPASPPCGSTTWAHPRQPALREGVPVKVVSERLGHAHIAHTLETYQHVLPGMQEDAARTAERLADPRPKPEEGHEASREVAGGTSWEHPEEGRLIRRNVP